MNLDFVKSVRQMGKRALPVLTGLLLFPLAAKATDSIASFTDYNITSPPQVDATNFYNAVTWNIFPSYSFPYQTAHTLNYVNDGAMYAYIGWEFDYGLSVGGPPSGRGMSASFFNDGTIAALDYEIVNPIYYYPWASYVLVSATNIANVNGGTLSAGAGGEIVLNGSNVDLSYGTLQIGGLTATGSGNGRRTFSPDTAVYDEWWQQTNMFPTTTTHYALDSSSIWNGAIASTPVFDWNGLCQATNVPMYFSVYNTVPPYGLADSLTNVLSYTNIVVTNSDGTVLTGVTTNHVPAHVFLQAVFADVGDPNISVDDGFIANSDNVSNLFRTITVRFTSALGGTAYLADTLGAWTNRGLLLNANINTGNNPQNSCTDPTFRPANYTLSRVSPFGAGVHGLGPPDTNFLYNLAMTNPVVPADYAGYEGYVDDLVRNPLGASLTNLPGRIIINATNLDLTWTTISNAQAEVVVHASNLKSSVGTLVACRNISYNLGSFSHNLTVTNLALTTPIPGFHGNITAWSGLWTNGLMTVFTNSAVVTNTVGTNSVGTITNTVFTNITEMDFHVLLVDGTQLSSTEPVHVQDLILQSNAVNMTFSDAMTVMHTLFFGGQSLTIQGSLVLGGLTSYGDVADWNRSVAPSLLYFTNNGTLSIPRTAHFGDDGPTNYAAFVNNGAITVGGGETIDSTYYQNSGTESALSGYFVTTSIGKVQNATITCGQDINFTANSLKLDNSTLSAGSRLNFYVTDPANGSLYDSGGSAGNTLTCVRGFNLWEKPATGDLLGTKIEAINGSVVTNVWAGEDFGAATPVGYTNNMALGQLVLLPQGATRYPQRFIFKGASANNALYVDLLDLSQISSNNLAAALQMDNITVYYAAAKLSFTPPPVNGAPQEPEEYLNGMFGGHLRWVTNFAGPNSSVDVIINGQTYAVNRALRYSKIIDSNNNGIPNYYDTDPFSSPPPGSVPMLTLTVSIMPQQEQSSTNSTIQSEQPVPPSVAALSWMAAPDAVYQLQYSTNLLPGAWLPLLNYTNTASTNRIVTIQDTNALSGQRFYRISRP